MNRLERSYGLGFVSTFCLVTIPPHGSAGKPVEEQGVKTAMTNPVSLMRFLEIAQKGSMRKAAEFLNISQPALSQSLRELELEIGFQLFERTPRGLSITPEGRQLAVYAKVLSNDMALLKDAVIAIRERRDVALRIGASASVTTRPH